MYTKGFEYTQPKRRIWTHNQTKGPRYTQTKSNDRYKQPNRWVWKQPDRRKWVHNMNGCPQLAYCQQFRILLKVTFYQNIKIPNRNYFRKILPLFQPDIVYYL